MKRVLASRAADTYVLASTDKIGAASRYTVLALAQVAGIITDAPPNNPNLAELRQQGIPIITAR